MTTESIEPQIFMWQDQKRDSIVSDSYYVSFTSVAMASYGDKNSWH
jgi:hypothetical protein